tara:strand:+ start:164 stop:559 length:396 start_codon:yes stop_codon:yes gene_type:complete
LGDIGSKLVSEKLDLMGNFRAYIAAIVCLFGLLGGCAHYVRIDRSVNSTERAVQKKSTPIYLKTYCVPVFTGAAALPWLGGTIYALGDKNGEPLVVLVLGLPVTAGAALFDYLRCGRWRPEVTTFNPNMDF